MSPPCMWPLGPTAQATGACFTCLRALGYLGIHIPGKPLAEAWWAQNSAALSCDPLCLQSLWGTIQLT